MKQPGPLAHTKSTFTKKSKKEVKKIKNMIIIWSILLFLYLFLWSYFYITEWTRIAEFYTTQPSGKKFPKAL